MFRAWKLCQVLLTKLKINHDQKAFRKERIALSVNVNKSLTLQMPNYFKPCVLSSDSDCYHWKQYQFTKCIIFLRSCNFQFKKQQNLFVSVNFYKMAFHLQKWSTKKYNTGMLWENSVLVPANCQKIGGVFCSHWIYQTKF